MQRFLQLRRFDIGERFAHRRLHAVLQGMHARAADCGGIQRGAGAQREQHGQACEAGGGFHGVTIPEAARRDVAGIAVLKA